MISLNELLSFWGFNGHPFETYTAESEPRLSEYFVAPPYLDDMIGTASAMTPAFVFGARGIGKSAIRIYIEQLCTTENPGEQMRGRAISITYDDFSVALREGVEQVTVDKHLEAIIRKLMAATLMIIANHTLGEEITKATIQEHFPLLDIDTVAFLVRTYYEPLNDVQKKASLEGVYQYFKGASLTMSDRAQWFRQIWDLVKTPIVDIANIFVAARGNSPIPVTGGVTNSHGRNTQELINDLQTVAGLTDALNIDGWYVLIDKVDEDEHTDSNPVKAAKAILPLVKNLRILELPRIGFKFFLWDQLKPTLIEENVRLDKVRNWDMEWTKQELMQMVKERLSAYSDGQIDDLALITEDRVTDFYDQIIYYAMNSPREMMHILDEIFREHARHSTQETGALITAKSISKGLDNYCERRIKSLYPSEITRTLTRLPFTQFTNNDIQSLFRISQQGASARINKWVDGGFVERAEDARSKKDPSKSVYQYKIRDKRLERIIQRKLSEENWN